MSSPRWHRIRRRLPRHHLPLLLLVGVSTGLLYGAVDSDDVIFRLSMATAYPGLALLSATLLTGPFRVIRRLPNPVSDDLTRDVGIWAALVSLAHVVFGLQMHMRGRMWLLFLQEGVRFPYVRLDAFGVANHTGLAATVIVALLLATSNDRALRSLGTRRWKRLQRWNYGLFACVLLHGALYQIIEERSVPYPYVFAAMGVVVLVLQAAGFLHRRRRRA